MPAESDVEGCGAHHEDLPGTDPTKSPQIESPGTDMKTTRTSTGNDWAQSSGGAKHASHLQIVDPEGQGDEAEDGTSLPTASLPSRLQRHPSSSSSTEPLSPTEQVSSIQEIQSYGLSAGPISPPPLRRKTNRLDSNLPSSPIEWNPKLLLITKQNASAEFLKLSKLVSQLQEVLVDRGPISTTRHILEARQNRIIIASQQMVAEKQELERND
ncbi:MAG: hypothetical protein L6R38_001025 [Xanthoria sp. 2 TBL-2021]|nr:MAG: hypothetical protein L6R38_001025 [Xanthoria sp. 2 TBL-2021]